MNRAEFGIFFNFSDNLRCNQLAGVIFTTMHHPMSHGFNCGKIFERPVFFVDQKSHNNLQSSFVIGQRLLEKIKSADKSKLFKMLNEINPNEAAQKLNRGDALLERAAKDKDFLKKLTNILD